MANDEGIVSRQLIGRAGLTLVGAVGGGVLLFVSEIVLARYLGLQRYGYFALAYTTVKIVEVFSLAGMRATMMHFLPIQLTRGAHGAFLGTLRFGLGLPAILSVGFAASLLLLAEPIATGLFGEPGMTPYLMVLGLAAPGLVLSDIAGNCARAMGRMMPYVLGRNLLPPALIIAVAVVFIAFGADPGPQVAYGVPIAFGAGAVVGLCMLSRAVRAECLEGTPSIDGPAITRYALPVLANAVLYMAIGWTDILMLGHFHAASDVGLYRACMQMVIAFDMVALALNAASARSYSHLDEQGRIEELQSRHRLALRAGMTVSVAFLAMILFNASDLLGLMGEDFRAAASALTVLAIGAVFRGLSGNVGFLLAVTGRQRCELIALICATSLNVALNLALIPPYGIEGAAAATTLSMVALGMLRVYMVRSRNAVRPLALVHLRPLVGGACAFVLAAGLCSAAGVEPDGGWWSFGTRVVVLSIALGVFTWMVALRSGERARAMEAFSRRGCVE